MQTQPAHLIPTYTPLSICVLNIFSPIPFCPFLASPFSSWWGEGASCLNPDTFMAFWELAGSFGTPNVSSRGRSQRRSCLWLPAAAVWGLSEISTQMRKWLLILPATRLLEWANMNRVRFLLEWEFNTDLRFFIKEALRERTRPIKCGVNFSKRTRHMLAVAIYRTFGSLQSKSQRVFKDLSPSPVFAKRDQVVLHGLWIAIS